MKGKVQNACLIQFFGIIVTGPFAMAPAGTFQVFAGSGIYTATSLFEGIVLPEQHFDSYARKGQSENNNR